MRSYKEQELLDKFSPEFQKKIMVSPIASKVFDTLNYGGNHFDLFEQLINIIDNQQEELTKFYQNRSPSPILMQYNPKVVEKMKMSNELLLKEKTFFQKFKILFNIK